MTGTRFTLDLGDGLTASEPLDRMENRGLSPVFRQVHAPLASLAEVLRFTV